MQISKDIFLKPFHTHNEDGAFPAIILVEHARNFIPDNRHGLGLTKEQLQTHIAWDIGVEKVTKHISDALDIPSIFGNYSRLLIDINRSIHDKDLIAEESDGIKIKGNYKIKDEDKEARIKGVYEPYHNAAHELVSSIKDKSSVKPLVITIHSFTPKMATEEINRPWDICLSTYDSDDILEYFNKALLEKNVEVGLHEPYNIKGYRDSSLDKHSVGLDLPQILIEIRQDLISDDDGIHQWARLLREIIKEYPVKV